MVVRRQWLYCARRLHSTGGVCHPWKDQMVRNRCLARAAPRGKIGAVSGRSRRRHGRAQREASGTSRYGRVGWPAWARERLPRGSPGLRASMKPTTRFELRGLQGAGARPMQCSAKGQLVGRRETAGAKWVAKRSPCKWPGAGAELSAAAALCKLCCKRLVGSGEGGEKRTEMSDQQRWWRHSKRSMRSAAEPTMGARGVCGRQGCRYGGWRCRRGRGGWEQGGDRVGCVRRQGVRMRYRVAAFEGGCGAAVGIRGRSKVILGRGGTSHFLLSLGKSAARL